VGVVKDDCKVMNRIDKRKNANVGSEIHMLGIDAFKVFK